MFNVSVRLMIIADTEIMKTQGSVRNRGAVFSLLKKITVPQIFVFFVECVIFLIYR